MWCQFWEPLRKIWPPLSRQRGCLLGAIILRLYNCSPFSWPLNCSLFEWNFTVSSYHKFKECSLFLHHSKLSLATKVSISWSLTVASFSLNENIVFFMAKWLVFMYGFRFWVSWVNILTFRFIIPPIFEELLYELNAAVHWLYNPQCF